MVKTETRFQVFKQLEDAGGGVYRDTWRWRLVHRNGNILADGGEPYNTKDNAKRAVNNLCRYMHAPVEVIEEE